MFQGQFSCLLDLQSFGTTTIIACAVTFILTLTISVIVTFIVTCMFVKRKNHTTATDSLYDTVLPSTNRVEFHSNPAYGKSDKVVMDKNPAYDNYETVLPSTNNVELQPNPAYGTSDKVVMYKNPAYKSLK